MPADAYDTFAPDGLLRETDGVTYAYLPSATVQAHACNLATLPDGSLGCVWFGGTQEGVKDIAIWFSTLADDAGEWTAPVQVSDDPTRSEQNPILFSPDGAELWLLYTAQLAGNQDTAEVRRRRSYDSGRTWSAAETLFPADETGGVFVRQRPLRLRTGRILLPIFRCLTTPGEKWSGDNDDSAVMISDDGGSSWRRVLVPQSTGCVHMGIEQLSDGSLLALFRSRWADWVYLSRSADDGETWAAPAPTELPNNNSSIQMAVFGPDRIALVFNDTQAEENTPRRASLYDEIDDEGLIERTGPGQDAAESDPGSADAARPTHRAGTSAAIPSVEDAEHGGRRAFWGTPRAPMTLAISDDGGRTWGARRNLEVGDGYCLSNNSRDGLNREFSYPSVFAGADGALHVGYTYFRKGIKYVRIRPAWVSAGDTTPAGRRND